MHILKGKLQKKKSNVDYKLFLMQRVKRKKIYGEYF